MKRIEFTVKFGVDVNPDDYVGIADDGVVPTLEDIGDFETDRLETGDLSLEEFIADEEIDVTFKVVDR